MLEIIAIMNSAVEDIFGFKTCCGVRAFDQNLEILIKNKGIGPVVVPSYCDLHGIRGTRRITTLMPNGDQQILPGEVKAFYCMMDEVLWNEARRLVFYDKKGNVYPVDVRDESQD
ncbi:MAG: hypothetical protein QG552_2371 [Thermodesulfobacteriota bacterium]|nr:hypothetical protein [Thermodesulfobacteriota bacterium]